MCVGGGGGGKGAMRGGRRRIALDVVGKQKSSRRSAYDTGRYITSGRDGVLSRSKTRKTLSRQRA